MTTPYERNLEQLFYRSVRAAGGVVEKVAPTRAGMPDRIVLLPGGRVYLVELKRDRENPSPIQKIWHERAAALGTTVVVLRGAAEIMAWLEETCYNASDRELRRHRRAVGVR